MSRRAWGLPCHVNRRKSRNSVSLFRGSQPRTYTYDGALKRDQLSFFRATNDSTTYSDFRRALNSVSREPSRCLHFYIHGLSTTHDAKRLARPCCSVMCAQRRIDSAALIALDRSLTLAAYAGQFAP